MTPGAPNPGGNALDSVLRGCLEDLERRIDADDEERLLSEWRRFADGGHPGEGFAPRRAKPLPPGTAWPRVGVNEAFADPVAMALQQFGGCSDRLAAGDGLLMCVRCNYGTCILPSLFGAELFLMSEAADTLPANRPLPEDALTRALDGGVPDPRTGLGARVLDTAAFLQDIMAPYPKVRRFVRLYHPDLQGPLDAAELLRGGALFLEMLEDPDRVDRLLALVTDAYAGLMDAWVAMVPFDPAHNVHWGYLHRGALMIRDDSSTNLSPELVARFVAPHNGRLMARYGGGAAHFCGRGDHIAGVLAGVPGVYALNSSQPEMNDLERLFAATIDRGVCLLGFPEALAREAASAGRPLRGLVHVL